MNELALRKILKKFLKNYLMLKDNTLDKKLVRVINETSFKIEDGKMTRELQILSDNILLFYAEVFCKGNRKAARKQLDV